MTPAQLKSFLSYCNRVAQRDLYSTLEQSFDDNTNRVKVRLVDDCDKDEVGAFFIEYAGQFQERHMLHVTDCVYGESANYFCEAQSEILLAMLVQM